MKGMDEGFMSENTGRVIPTNGGRRKKRLQKRKTKSANLKEIIKTRKRRNFNKKYYRKKNNQCTKKRKTNKKKKLFGGMTLEPDAAPELAVDNNLIIKKGDLFRGTDGYAMAKSFLFDEKRLTGGPEVGKITGESCGRDSDGVSVWYIDDSGVFDVDPKRVLTLLFGYSEKSADHFERISSLEDILSKVKEDQPDRENISLESVELDYLTDFTACSANDWKRNRETRKIVLKNYEEINERNKNLWEYIQEIGIDKFSDLFRLSKIPILLKVRQIGDDDGTTGSVNLLNSEKRFEVVEIIEIYTNKPIPDDLMVILDKYKLPHPKYITSIKKV